MRSGVVAAAVGLDLGEPDLNDALRGLRLEHAAEQAMGRLDWVDGQLRSRGQDTHVRTTSPADVRSTARSPSSPFATGSETPSAASADFTRSGLGWVAVSDTSSTPWTASPDGGGVSPQSIRNGTRPGSPVVTCHSRSTPSARRRDMDVTGPGA